MPRVAIPENRETKAIVVAVCTYEVAAIMSSLVPPAARRITIPTVTAIHRRWPVVGGAILVALAIHFFTPDPTLPKET